MKSKIFEIMQYQEHVNWTFEKIKEIIEDLPGLQKYAFILHDKDTKEDGTVKAPHWHIFVSLSVTTCFSTIANKFGIEEQYVNKVKSRFNNACLYCIHKHNLEKYQYDASEVYTNFNYLDLVDDDTTEVIDFENHSLLFYQQRYISNVKKLRELDVLWKNYVKVKTKLSISRNIQVSYFTGTTGSGKTTMAKAMLREAGYTDEEIFITGSSNDILDGYDCQKAIIIDDFREDSMKFNDLLKFIDNNSSSNVKSRYYNKSLFRCEVIIFTSVVSIEDLYLQRQQDHTDSIYQLFRRVPTLYVVSKEKEDIIMEQYNYTELDKNYHFSKRKLVTNMFEAEIERNKIEKKDIFAFF